MSFVSVLSLFVFFPSASWQSQWRSSEGGGLTAQLVSRCWLKLVWEQSAELCVLTGGADDISASLCLHALCWISQKSPPHHHQTFHETWSCSWIFVSWYSMNFLFVWPTDAEHWFTYSDLNTEAVTQTALSNAALGHTLPVSSHRTWKINVTSKLYVNSTNAIGLSICEIRARLHTPRPTSPCKKNVDLKLFGVKFPQLDRCTCSRNLLLWQCELISSRVKSLALLPTELEFTLSPCLGLYPLSSQSLHSISKRPCLDLILNCRAPACLPCEQNQFLAIVGRQLPLRTDVMMKLNLVIL